MGFGGRALEASRRRGRQVYFLERSRRSGICGRGCLERGGGLSCDAHGIIEESPEKNTDNDKDDKHGAQDFHGCFALVFRRAINSFLRAGADA